MTIERNQSKESKEVSRTALFDLKNKKVLLLGSSGLVGSDLTHNLGSPSIYFPRTNTRFNLLDKRSIQETVELTNPNCIINLVSMTNVGAAERQKGNKNVDAWRLNVEGLGNLVNVIKNSNIQLIHISTDMVFTGSSHSPGPYEEDRPVILNPNILSWYGYTKALQEKIVLEGVSKASIVRISNPVPEKLHRKIDFARKIINLYKHGYLYPLFNDQTLTVTYVPDLRNALIEIVNANHTGIFHVSSTDITTPYKIGKRLICLRYGSEAARNIKSVSIENFLKGENKLRYMNIGGLLSCTTQKTLNIQFLQSDMIAQIVAKEN